MNYWSELGWIVIPMNAIEIGFTLIMCYGAHLLDKRKN